MNGKPGFAPATAIQKPAFVNIRQFDRWKRLLLGLPVPIVRQYIPWGYDKDVNNPKMLIPDINALRLLVDAREYTRQCPFTQVATWIGGETGRPLSHEGLRLILMEKFPFREIMLSDDDRENAYRNPTDFYAITEDTETQEELQEEKPAGYSGDSPTILS